MTTTPPPRKKKKARLYPWISLGKRISPFGCYPVAV
jgi:hypothetical protein